MKEIKGSDTYQRHALNLLQTEKKQVIEREIHLPSSKAQEDAIALSMNGARRDWTLQVTRETNSTASLINIYSDISEKKARLLSREMDLVDRLESNGESVSAKDTTRELEKLSDKRHKINNLIRSSALRDPSISVPAPEFLNTTPPSLVGRGEISERRDDIAAEQIITDGERTLYKYERQLLIKRYEQLRAAVKVSSTLQERHASQLADSIAEQVRSDGGKAFTEAFDAAQLTRAALFNLN